MEKTTKDTIRWRELMELTLYTARLWFGTMTKELLEHFVLEVREGSREEKRRRRKGG